MCSLFAWQWCGHCKKLAPEYAGAAAVLGAQDPPLYVAKVCWLLAVCCWLLAMCCCAGTISDRWWFTAQVDATANRDLGSRFGVQGFPTLKFFRNGKASDYGGGRTKDTIVSWVNKKSGPAARTLTSTDEAEAIIESQDVVVIGFFEDPTSAEAKGFFTAAGGNDDVTFGITSDEDIAAKYDASFPSVQVFKKFDEGRATFEGDVSSAEDIATFVAGHQLPLVIEFSQEMAPKIFGGPVKTHLLVMVDSEEAYFEGLKADLSKVAAANQGKILAITVNLENERVMSYFGVTEDDLPTAVLVNMPEGGQMKKYKFNYDTVNEENLNALVNGYFDGSVKPFLKSADPPASNDEPVKVVVGTTFADIALDPTKDVLLEFYAPWCGHCKALAPKYDELAERLSGVDSIVIAKMDATANEIDHEGVNVSGFPTLKFFPASDDGKVIDFNGSREVDDFIEFLQKNAAIKFTLDGEDESEL